jgi:hypothetical protein
MLLINDESPLRFFQEKRHQYVRFIFTKVVYEPF